MTSECICGISHAVLLLNVVLTAAYASPPQHAVQQQYTIAAGEMAGCINEVARTGSVFVAADSSLTAGKYCQQLSELLTTEQALSRVLADSGLHYQQIGERHFVIKPLAVLSAAAKSPTEIVVSFSLPERQATALAAKPDWQQTTSQSSGIRQTVKQTPQTISMLNTAAFQPFNQTDLGEVLRSSAGIYSTANSFTGNREFRARGQLLNPFMIDNQPFADANFAVSDLDIVYFDLLEINRGSNGIVQDNGINSASVNLRPKEAGNTVARQGSLSLGDQLKYRISADITGAVLNRQDLSGRAVVVAQRQQDAADYSDNSRYGALARLSWQPGAASQIELYHIAQADRQQQRSKIRPLLYADLTHYDGPLSTNFWPVWAGAQQNMSFSRLIARQQLASQWQSSLHISRASQQQTALVPDVFGYPDRQTLSLSFGALDNSFEFAADKVALTLDGAMLLADLPLDVSITASRAWHQNYQLLQLMDYQATTVLQPHSFTALNRNQARPTAVADSFVNDSHYQISGLKLAGKIALTDSTLLSASLRRNHSRYNNKGSFATDTERTQYTNLYFGLSQAIGTAQWYVSYANTVDFRQGYLSMLDLVVSPVRFASWETGIKADFWQQRGQFTVSAYRSEQRNYVQLVAESFPAQSGWEVALAYQSHWLQLDASYSRSFSAASPDTVAQRQFQFPDSLYRLMLSTPLDTLIAGSTLGIAVEGETRQHYQLPAFSRRQPVAVSQPASWRLNSYYRVAAGHGRVFTLSIKNLLDKAYFDGVDMNRGWAAYGAPRHFSLTFEQQF
ncbi:MAG: TonB-dependent receptor [Gammaproteobacteria bacterium]|nr:TonB-dependent receptor [Gammaproteobacteria bacterium]MBU1555692.1 TonB-dependent receptor [Gammaproteobacteria bacterium]MBU2071161.1 TonB-dependent receptor [Gammaproteobacteria bacterium]MBU2184389.1 TonB-dependent receptor [Gammaproteobacteria bacterium]MBU2206229.1 TonB-dependent receptor [Gammaproteobacteria bacterium]